MDMSESLGRSWVKRSILDQLLEAQKAAQLGLSVTKAESQPINTVII